MTAQGEGLSHPLTPPGDATESKLLGERTSAEWPACPGVSPRGGTGALPILDPQGRMAGEEAAGCGGCEQSPPAPPSPPRLLPPVMGAGALSQDPPGKFCRNRFLSDARCSEVLLAQNVSTHQMA